MDVAIPISTQVSKAAALDILGDFKTDLLARTQLQLMLYDQNIATSPNNTIATFVGAEAHFGGYARVTVATFDGPYLDPQAAAYMSTLLAAFPCDGTAGDTIYGSLLVGSVPGGVRATATNAGNAGNYAAAFVLTNAGTRYTFPPAVHLTGATGANATAHATLNPDGTLAAIVLDNPGNGAYTTFTVVIDYPLELIQQAQLSANGIPIAQATDAVLSLQQVTVPSLLN